MKDVYEQCPTLENENFKLRLVEKADAPDLLKVYSDEKAVPLFNSDNCDGDDFHYTTLERMEEAIAFWLWAYKDRGFVRWSILDKASNEAVGTIELFHRESQDYFNHCGLLRLDLRSDYERKDRIVEILSLIMEQAYVLFDCTMLATKAIPSAVERRMALEALGYEEKKEMLISPEGTPKGGKYGDYWSCYASERAQK